MSMNPLSSHSTSLRRATHLLNRIWSAATAPSKAIESPEGRRQAQVLSAMLLAIAVLSPIRVLLMHNYGAQTLGRFLYNSYLLVMFTSIVIFLAAYVLSRTRYYRVAAGLVLIITPLAIFGAISSAPMLNLDLARYLALDLVICGIVFSIRTTILVALVYTAASLFILYGLLAIPASDVIYTLTFLIFATVLITTFVRFRDLAERDRQHAMDAARDELRASSELYRTLARNLPQSAVLLYDRNLHFILAEGSALPQIGLSPNIEGKSLHDVFEPGTTPAIESEYYAALAGEERTRERVINGENFRARYLPVRNDSGVIVAGMLLLQNITREKQSEKALRESEERYRLIAENATDLISVQTPDGDFLYASPASNVLLGYQPEELIGHSLYDFLHPEDVDRVRRVRRQTLDTPGVTTIAYRFHLKDGSYTWLESASRVINNAATGIQIVTASRDVSERMDATEALRRSEEQFRSLVASMNNLVFSIDLKGRFLVYHPMPSSIYDTPFDTDLFLGKHYAEVLPPPLVTKLDESVRAVTLTLTTQQIDYSLKEPDDEERFYSARISPMIAPNLQLLGSTVVVSDVTEAVRARERQERLLGLESIQREIGLLLLASDDPNTVIDRVLEILGSFFDVARAYMFTLRENERLLDSAHEWCAPGIAPDIQNLQGLAYDQLFPSLLPLLVSEGVVAPTHISELPPDLFRAFDALGLQSALILPIFVDERLEGFVSFYELRHPRKWQLEEIAAARTLVQSYARLLEREKAQLDLIEARDEAIRSAKLKSDFVSNMSHELRTPMTGVIGMLDLLHETTLTDDQKEFVGIAHSSANRLLALIGDILDFSKIEAGKVALEHIPMDVRGIVTEIQSLLNLQAEKKQLQLTAAVDDDVPARVLGDPTRLRQILTNLVGNALKFTQVGSVHIGVHQLSAMYGRSRLRFEVKDTGIGIPANRQAQIFDSFVQADSSTTRRYGGAGLGLAICKQLVALMGGDMDVSSVVGEGSTFGFTLVLPIVALTNRATLNTDFNFLQVMVMDEENSARYLLGEQIRLWGTNVIEASTMDEARELLIATAKREEAVDILFFRSLSPLEEQEALLDALRDALDMQMPLLIQLYDDETLTSSSFDLHLRRPVHPTDLYQLLANHANREFAADPISSGGVLTPPAQLARILVADDEPMNRQIVVHALEQFGYQVDVAGDGQEVLALFGQQDYRLILMDMHMPIMDGLETTRHIRALDDIKKRVPIIAFTASIEQEQRRRYLDNGISAILGKPFTLRELRQTVETWISDQPAVQSD